MAESLTTHELVTMPLYTYADADRLATVSHGTARRWLSGYAYATDDGLRVSQPPVTVVDEVAEHLAVSFMELVEVIAIGGLKRAGFSLTRIREIVKNCQDALQVERPLTTLRFKTGGREIFVDRGEILLEITKRKGNQAWSQFLNPFLETLDYTNETASRWWPQGKVTPIVVDPAYGFGFPVIVGSGVRTEIISERFEAGDLPDQIARDFNLAPLEVERALQFELKLAKAA